MSDGHGSTSVIPPAPARPDLPHVTWRWWEAVVVFLIGGLIGGLIAAPIVAAVHSHKLDQLTLAMAGEVALGGTTTVWLWGLHRRSIHALGFPSRLGLELGAGVLGGLAIYVLGVFVIGAGVASILHAVSNHGVHSPRQLPVHLSGGQIALAGLTVLVFAPVAEELFFRGLLFRSLRSGHGFAFAAGVSALCFGAVHFQGGAWQNALLLPIVMCFVGFALAWLYERRGNIVANMAAHATFNIVGFVLIVTLNR